MTTNLANGTVKSYRNPLFEIDEINLAFKTNIPYPDHYSTLNGLLHEQLHDIPKVGDVVKISSLSIKIEQVEKNKPVSIRIQRILDEE